MDSQLASRLRPAGVGGARGFGGRSGYCDARLSRSLQRDLDLQPLAKKWLVAIGRAGHAARSAIFVLIGYFLIISAAQSNTREVRDMAGALDALQKQHFGMILYSSIALGLIAFGAFEFIQALYRKVGVRS